MTRKRFIKLLMAEGYSRNYANVKAAIVVDRGFCYERAYQIAIFANHLEKIGVTSAKMSEAIMTAIQGIRNFATKAINAVERSVNDIGNTANILLADELEGADNGKTQDAGIQ